MALVAPAGFGKSTLVRQYLAGRSAYGTCDCTGVTGELELSRRLVRALAEESPARAAALARMEIALADGGRSMAERIGSVLDAWREPSSGSVVFEQAESLGEPARALLGRVLASLPPERRAIVCTRESLRLHLTRFVAPHEIVAVRADELAFDAQDVRQIFSPETLDDRAVERIVSVSRGWPIAVLLLRRFAAEGRIAPLLYRLGDVAFDELHDYLTDTVLAPLGDGLTAAIFACAAIPQATRADLQAAVEDDPLVEQLERIAAESPFVYREADGAFAVHPILASLLVERRRRSRLDLLARVARRHEASGDFERAAELHLARDDREAAAAALARADAGLERGFSIAYARVLEGLEPARLLRYPRLWSASCLRRALRVDIETLLDEAGSAWRMMPPSAALPERWTIATLRVLMACEIGRLDEARAAIDEIARPAGSGAPPDEWIGYLRSLVWSRSGRLGEAERVLVGALPLVAAMELPAYCTFLTLGVEIARARGERALERQFLDRAIDLARRSPSDNLVALALAESAFGAWLAGEDAAMAPLVAEAGDVTTRCGVAGLASLASSLAGVPSEPGEAVSTRHAAYVHLIAASRAAGEPEGARRARAAASAAQRHDSPFVEVLAAIALALCEPAEFDEAAARAVAAAARCDATALRDAAEAFARREPAGFLEPFVKRFARARRESFAPVEVEVASGTVRVRGREVRLAGREAELLFALASHADATARTRLAAMLWPEFAERAALNALSVCLHRLRRHVGETAVVRDGDGYRLGEGVRVDAWEFERMLAEVRPRRRLDDADRAALSQVSVALSAQRPPRMERWEWFEPAARRVDALRVEVTHRLGADALERGDPEGALASAQAILAHDPLDEPAREMLVRAHLALNDRAAAMRSYREYRELLADELQVEPSPTLTKLLYS